MKDAQPSVPELHDANEWRIQHALDLLREASRNMQANPMHPCAIKGAVWRLADAAGLVAQYIAQVYGIEAVPPVATGELTGRGFGFRIAADVRFRMQHNDGAEQERAPWPPVDDRPEHAPQPDDVAEVE